VVKIANVRRTSPQSPAHRAIQVLKNSDIFELARPLHCYWHRPDGGRQELQKGLPMFTSFSTARETATLFAGALITALLLVSAATSLPIA
jgi:hypothetical protein